MNKHLALPPAPASYVANTRKFAYDYILFVVLKFVGRGSFKLSGVRKRVDAQTVREFKKVCIQTGHGVWAAVWALLTEFTICFACS